MPRGRTAAAPSLSMGALATIRALRDQIEAAKQKLRDERAAAVAKIDEIDQALGELGETSPPPRRGHRKTRAEGDARSA